MLKENIQKKTSLNPRRQSDEIENNLEKSIVAKTHYMTVLHKERLDIKDSAKTSFELL